MVVVGCGWLWLVVVGCGWLWLVVVGCGWLWLVVVGCGWLLVVCLFAGFTVAKFMAQGNLTRRHRSSVSQLPEGVYLVKKNVVGCVVFINMLLIGLETDGVDWPIWGVAEVLFVLFYSHLAACEEDVESQPR